MRKGVKTMIFGYGGFVAHTIYRIGWDHRNIDLLRIAAALLVIGMFGTWPFLAALDKANLKRRMQAKMKRLPAWLRLKDKKRGK